MIESDDSDVLADIKALDEVLGLNTDENPKSTHNHSRCSSPLTDVEPDNSNDVDFDLNQDIDESQTAYDINKRLIKGLMLVKVKLTRLLQECEQKIEQLDEDIKTHSVESSVSSRLMISAGMPYFKDKNHFGAPNNDDTKIKEARGELFLLSLAKPSRWSAKDREMLLRAVYNEAIESVLSGEFNEEIDEELSEEVNTLQAKKVTLVLPRNFSEMVGAVGKREFDWYKIAATDFDNKHSAGECRAMWNVYLHPDINKSEWAAVEDKKLLRYAKQCRFQDWDTITAKLSTKRSAYQCFIRYNTIKKVPSYGRAWSKQEDKHLIKVINKLKIGDYIPWSEVANYLRHRTKQQVYTRWMYRTAPHLKKGRFTYTETDALLKAVRQYGTDFSKISSTVMPHRTTVQLHEHYRTMKMSKNANIWTIDDDMKLIRLYRMYGNNWSKIATKFSRKSRTQVRHRYNALIKYTTKGVSIESIPRQPALTDDNASTSSIELTNLAFSQLIGLPIQCDLQPRLFETLSFPPSIEIVNSSELYNPGQLACNTKKLHNILNLLDTDLDIPDNFLSYVHLTKKQRQLVVSLKKYINAEYYQTENHELIEKFRLQMFGPVSNIDESSRFIPPLPFGGYIRRKSIKGITSIDCNLDCNEKFLIEVPTELTPYHITSSFLTIEEENQFYKFSQLLITDCQYDKRNTMNHKLLKRILISDENNTQSSSKHNKHVNPKSRLKECKNKAGQPDNLKEITSTEHAENNENILHNAILPNSATLLGFKNLLLWKLLYEYENQSLPISQDKETTTPEYQKACQMLRIRLLRLFKFPMGLSNTIVQMYGSDTTFLTKDEQNTLKRKSENEKSTNKNKKRKPNILAISNMHENTNAQTVDQNNIKHKTVCKKYKVIIK